MKQLIILSAVIFISNTIIAQKNRVNVTINEFANFHGNLITDDTVYNYANQGIKLIPSIGYNRIIKNNWGIGCELGYRSQKTKLIDSFIDATNYLYAGLITSNIKTFYFCPSLFQIYYWNKFQLTTSIILPIEYQTKNSQYHFETEIDRTTNKQVRNKQTTTKLPKQINWGAYCNIGFYIKIYKNLYCGPQLGFGVTQQIKYSTSTENLKIIENGILTEYNTNIKYKKYSNSIFDLRPTFSINYNF